MMIVNEDHEQWAQSWLCGVGKSWTLKMNLNLNKKEIPLYEPIYEVKKFLQPVFMKANIIIGRIIINFSTTIIEDCCYKY